MSANYTPANAEKLEKAIFDEITYIQKYGVTEEELNTAKKMIEQETYYSRESTSNISIYSHEIKKINKCFLLNFIKEIIEEQKKKNNKTFGKYIVNILDLEYPCKKLTKSKL